MVNRIIGVIGWIGTLLVFGAVTARCSRSTHTASRLGRRPSNVAGTPGRQRALQDDDVFVGDDVQG